jgi:hypothetical protein
VFAVLALPSTVSRINAIEDEAHASVTRARLQSSLREVVNRAGPALPRCGEPALPNGLAWARGAIAWELGLPLARIPAMRTSAPEFVARLSSPGDEPLPRLGRGRLVTVRWAPNSFVLLAPFGGAQVRLAGELRRGLTTVAAAGVWRAVARDVAGCGVPDRRNLARD